MTGLTSVISLPAAKVTGRLSLEEAIARRRSQREFKREALTSEMLSQLLWSLQGVVTPDGLRTTPSAGALYPLEIYVSMQEGFFHYNPVKHELLNEDQKDLRPALCKAALDQVPVEQAPAVFVIAAVYERVAVRYGAKRGERYVLLECGHAAQNLVLQAVSLGLSSVLIGAFKDEDVSRAIALPANEHVIYLIPVGYER